MDLSILPPEWLAVLTWLVALLIGTFTFIGLVAVGLAAAKKALGAPTPEDPEWKQTAFKWLAYADPIAANSQRAKDALVLMQQSLVIAKQHQLIADHEKTIQDQARVIKDSMRPPAGAP